MNFYPLVLMTGFITTLTSKLIRPVLMNIFSPYQLKMFANLNLKLSSLNKTFAKEIRLCQKYVLIIFQYTPSYMKMSVYYCHYTKKIGDTRFCLFSCSKVTSCFSIDNHARNDFNSFILTTMTIFIFRRKSRTSYRR